MTDNLERARRFGAVMRRAAIAMAAIVAAITLWFVFKAATDGPWLVRTLQARFGDFAPPALTGLQSTLLIAVGLAQSAAILAGLREIVAMFGGIASTGGVEFDTAIRVRRAGLAFAVAALILVLSTPLETLIASIGQPEGRRFLSVGLESQHLLALLLSAVLVTLGHVLSLAADIAEDNRQIV